MTQGDYESRLRFLQHFLGYPSSLERISQHARCMLIKRGLRKKSVATEFAADREDD
jgi:hypothetical protein